MAKRTLAEAWILDGVTYGPGEVELPKEVDEILGKRKAFEADGTDPIAEALAAQGPQEDGDGEPSTGDDGGADAPAKAAGTADTAKSPKASATGGSGSAPTAPTATGSNGE